MKLTKSLLFAIFFLNSLFVFGQFDLSKYKKYDVNNVPKTQIEIDAPLDFVKNKFIETEGSNIKEISENKYQLFDDSQAFITEKSLKTSTSEREPYRWLYTHEGSLASLWEVNFIPLKSDKTKIEFQMKAALTDNSLEDYFNGEVLTQDQIWKKNYENQKLISRGIIENLTETFFRKRLLADLISIDFANKKSFDNKSYPLKNLEPLHNIKAEIQFNKQVPAEGESPTSKSILLYDRNQNIICLVDLATGKPIWKRTLENNDIQNLNTFNVYKNSIYVATSNGYIYALSLKTGEVYWRSMPQKPSGKVDTNNFFGQSLPISDDYIYANYNGRVFKFNRFNGQVEWAVNIGNYGHYNYSFDKNNVYKTGILECFVIDKRSGQIKKIINNTQENTFYSPNYLDQEKNIIYLGASYFYAYDLNTDKILWKNDNSPNRMIFDNNTFYVNASNVDIAAIDKTFGKTLWKNKDLKSDNGIGQYVQNIYNLKNEILVDINTENYKQKTKGKQLIFLNKKDGELNLINNFDDEVVTNPIIDGNNLYLVGPNKVVVMDITTKSNSEIKAELPFLADRPKDLDYEVYAELIDVK